MGCPHNDCGGGGGNQTPNNATLVRCINGHPLLNLVVTPNKKCALYGICSNKKKTVNNWCCPQVCKQYTDSVKLTMVCPVCGKPISVCYTDATFTYSVAQEEDGRTTVLDQRAEGSNITIVLGVA